MAPTSESTVAMNKAGRGNGRVQLRRLPPIAERDLEALRAHVEQTIARSKKLREMAARTGYTPEDVASEALARYLVVEDREIKNPAAWMVTAGRNFVYDLHKKGIHRETAAEPASRMFDQVRPGEQVPVDESLDRRYEHRLYDAAVRRLDEADRRAIAAFEQEGSMRAVEKSFGIPKSNVQRAFKRLQQVIVSESGEAAPRRARSRALTYHLGLASPPQRQELEARMGWDTGLLMEVRALQHGARRTAALFPAVAGPATAEQGASGLGDRIAAVGDRWREGINWVASRGAGHEAEAATGAGISGGGFAAKAIVAACIGGSAAAGVCVERGVVELPGADASQPPAETITSEPDPRPGGLPDLGSSGEAPSGQGEEIGNSGDSAQSEQVKPAAQVSNEIGFEQSGSAGSSSGGGEFGAPAGGGGSSGGGGSNGGDFGFEK